MCGLKFLEPAVDKALHVQARAAPEMFVWGIKKMINSGCQCGVHGQQGRNGPSFEGKHWEKRWSLSSGVIIEFPSPNAVGVAHRSSVLLSFPCSAHGVSSCAAELLLPHSCISPVGPFGIHRHLWDSVASSLFLQELLGNLYLLIQSSGASPEPGTAPAASRRGNVCTSSVRHVQTHGLSSGSTKLVKH